MSKKGSRKINQRRTRMCKRCSGTGSEYVPAIPAVSSLYGGPGTAGMKAYTKNCDGCDGRGSL